jgi:hypothetical protein
VTTVRRRIAWALCLLVLGARLAASEAPTEDRVKAAFVYNFAQFIVWPAQEVPAKGPVIVGILGSGAMRPALEEVLRGKEQKGRHFEVRVFDRPEDVRDCQILILDLPDPRRTKALEMLPRPGLLTIGDGEAFARQGGVIALVKAGNRLKFDLNLASVERAGLRVDPTLLGLARKAGRW